MSASLTTRAPAKINLTLHVLGRRADGYHALESLVAFAGVGDTVSLEPGPELALSLEGPTAPQSGDPAENLVLKAARLLAEGVDGLNLGRFRLVKRLPVAAGIGGGSSDAAAALRLLARHNGLPLRHPAVAEAARRTGADVPVCLEARARMMRGIGDDLGPALHLPPLFAVLVNPGVPVATAAVFKALALEPGAALPGPGHPDTAPGDDLLERLRRARNDLEAPAVRLRPVIRTVLDLLGAAPGCRLARMSGSGATVFGLFEDRRAATDAATRIRRAEPGWWVKATGLR